MHIKYIIGAVIVTIAILSFGIMLGIHISQSQQSLRQPEKNVVQKERGVQEDRIGGQRDEHGCLGPAGYTWCPSQEKCMRVWEEFCEDYPDQFRNNAAQNAEGDAGENPPEEAVNWSEYVDEEHALRFQYPPSFRAVEDQYGWPHAIVHLIRANSGQSYDMTVEVWNGENDANNEGRANPANAFFAMVEHPTTGMYISFTCWNEDVARDCQDIYNTVRFE